MADERTLAGVNGKQGMTIAVISAIVALGGFFWKVTSSATSNLADATTQSLSTIRDDFARQQAQIDHLRDLVEAHSFAASHPVAAEWDKTRRAEIAQMLGLMHEDDVRELADAGNDDSFREKLREIETQFLHVDRFLQLLWARVYEEPLPNPPERSP